MIRIRRSIAALVAAVLVLGAATGCQRKVEVETGERVLCTYGHSVSDSVKTIEVPARDASLYTVATRTITCDMHVKAEEQYAKAQDAIEASDLEAAEKALTAVVALDPDFRKAGAQLKSVQAGKKPEPDRSTPAPQGTSGQPEQPAGEDDEDTAGEVTGPIASLTGWMPDNIAGFKAEPTIADTMSLSREYVASKGGKKVLVVSAEQVLSAKEAESMIARLKNSYDQDGKSLKLGGNPAYAGSDGRSVVVVGIADGPVFIALQMTSDSGSTSSLVSELIKIAEGLPK